MTYLKFTKKFAYCMLNRRGGGCFNSIFRPGSATTVCFLVVSLRQKKIGFLRIGWPSLKTERQRQNGTPDLSSTTPAEGGVGIKSGVRYILLLKVV